MIPNSELILNPDGSVYHLHLRPEHVANTVLTVGDQNRVGAISKYFDSMEYQVQNREFLTHTGYLNGKRLTVISTGIGTDNIDIVLNELDALVNVDLKTRTVKEKLTTLDIIRVGTSGCLQADIPLDSFVATAYAIGLEGLMGFYEYAVTEREKTLLEAFKKQTMKLGVQPHCFEASPTLLKKFEDFPQGITVTCSGFYAPQGRQVRAKLSSKNTISQFAQFKYDNFRLTNLEMETAGIYGLSRCLGHNALSISALLANRMTHAFSDTPKKTVERLIQRVLKRLTS